MTVCIAANYLEPDGSQGIILCSDALVSGYLGKAETMLKIKRLVPRWSVLVAGDDSEIAALLTILKSSVRKRQAELDAQKQELIAKGDARANYDLMTEAEITKLVRDALATRKWEKADELIRGRYGISYKEFLATGKDKFPTDEYRRDIIEIGALDLGAELIVAGFSNGFAFLLETDAQGKTKVRDDFATVGSGASLALSVMMHRAHSDVHTYEQALYCVYEAKKYAQGQPNVGEHTNIVTLRNDGKSALLRSEGHKWLQARFEEFGPRVVPENIPCPDKQKFNDFK